MADEKSTEVEPLEVDTDTSTEEDQDTDTTDESSSDDLLDGEDTEGFDDEDEAATESDSEKESKEDVPDEPEGKSEEDEESEESKEPVKEDSEEATKRHNAEMAQKRIADKEAAKAEAQDKYLQEAEDDKDLALRQLQVDAYNNRIEVNNNKLQNGIEKAVATIDLFKDGSPEVQEALAESLDEFEAIYTRKDQNGDVIEVTGDVYQYLQRKADSIRRLTAVGATTQQRNKGNEKSRTLATPVKTPVEPKIDPMVEAFDEEAYS